MNESDARIRRLERRVRVTTFFCALAWIAIAAHDVWFWQSYWRARAETATRTHELQTQIVDLQRQTNDLLRGVLRRILENAPHGEGKSE